MRSSTEGKSKVVVVGGGLSGALVALKLHLNGFSDFLLVDQHELNGGEHTWSFHKTDVNEADYELLISMGASEWEGHSVKFKHYDRLLPGTYCSLRSEDFYKFLKGLLPQENTRLGEKVLRTHLSGDIEFRSGDRVSGALVLDARGQKLDHIGPLGYQKFVGVDLEFSEPHGLQQPVIMDATIQQKDGYRFFYLLPLTPYQILVEDTRYSSSADLDEKEFLREIQKYVDPRWGQNYELLRIERGVLPIPLTEQMFQNSRGRVQNIGVRGGYFHPVTSYSLPWALQVAEIIASNISLGTSDVQNKLNQYQKSWQKKCGFLFTLNRMMFGAAEDEERVKIFERFYTLPNSLIQRFYAGEMKMRDQARLLIGKPPVKITRAVKSLVQDTWM